MQWVISNIAWIKDILWVIFTLIATVIAILTYRRARYTLLQPLRSEVVKRQTELLVDLLEYISGENGKIYFEIDYMGIIACNAYKLLELCDFVLTDPKIGNAVQDNIGGFMFLKSSGEVNTFSMPTDPFNANSQKSSEKQTIYKKNLRNKIEQQGSIDELELLYLTKKHVATISRLEKYRDNPFMPQVIQHLLSQFINDIQTNIREPLLVVLEKFIVKATSIDSNENNPLNISYQSIYNDFLRYEKSHGPTIKQLTKSIREYLLVDAKWS